MHRDEDLSRACAGAALTRGLGRSYGDASLPAGETDIVACSVRADRILALDEARCVLRAEAGLSLAALEALLTPRGLACPVVPGTAQVTLGGMVAADVHGKNHHVAGTFGRHVRALRLALADGGEVEVTRETDAELFAATLGGLGLTGHILEVECALMRVPSAWMIVETEPVTDIAATLTGLAEASAGWPYTAAWTDGLARGSAAERGYVLRARWAERDEAPAMPPAAPRSWRVPPIPLTEALVRAHHGRHFARAARRRGPRLVSPAQVLHPLDAFAGWNRLYGRGGLVQHQGLLPGPDPGPAVARLLATLAAHGGRSWLTVSKDFGAAGEGLLSFPAPGVSVALDLPGRPTTPALVDALDALVAEAGGRIYLAKDALTRADVLRRMEADRLPRFNAVRDRVDPERRLRSALSVRLLGDAPAGGRAATAAQRRRRETPR